MSKYHFHRQCSAYFGVSVISLLRLLRLKRAAYQLAYREDSVISIALSSGYESHEAFSRAFKKHFNASPSEFRRNSNWTPWQKNYEPIICLRKKIMNDEANFEVEIIDFTQIQVAVKEHRGSPQLLGKSIQAFIAWRKMNKLPPSISRTFNFLYDDPHSTKPDDHRFDLCCAIQSDVGENDQGIVTKSIPAGKCAKIRHIGSDDTIGTIVTYLYSQWLPDSGFELRDFPIFLERVTFFPEVAEHEMITDIYLPIKSP
jgi:AraC family transcriptional regulator